MTGHSVALNFTTFMIRNQRSNIQQACTLMHKTVEGLATCTLSPLPPVKGEKPKTFSEGSFICNTLFLFLHTIQQVLFTKYSFDVSEIV